MSYSVKISGLEALKTNGRTYTRALLEQLAESVQETGDQLAEDARQNLETMDPPGIDTRKLYRSIRVKRSPAGLVARVIADVEHAPYIEFGTRPHFPPVQPIREWCERKGIDPRAAYAICLKIAERGTPERPFMRPAYQQNILTLYDTVLRNYPKAVNKIPQSKGVSAAAKGKSRRR